MGKTRKTCRGILLLAALLLVSSAASGRAAQPFGELLGQVPQAAFASGYLSYADIETLVRARPGADGPLDGDTEGSRQYRLATMGVTGGFPDLMMLFMMAEDVAQATGIDPRAVRQSMEIGQAPFNQAWLTGEIRPGVLEEALKKKDYGPVSEAGAAIPLWAADGSLLNAAAIDFARRDMGFLFGGPLGGRWPVAFRDGLAVASRDTETLKRIASGGGPTLAEQPAVKALLDAAARAGGGREGVIVQAYLLTPGHVWESGGWEVPPPELVLLAQADGEDASRVVLASYYADESHAQALLGSLKPRLPDAALASSGRSLEDLIGQMDGQMESPLVAPAPEGAGVLLLSFRYPTQAAAAEKNPDAASALPFRAFVTMLLKGDLGWAKP